jgi:antitoxin component YwqK of YwqJK toxin-antitoxin module
MNKAFKDYSFIAHVIILKKFALDKQDSIMLSLNEDLRFYSKVQVQIIELYKGNPEIMILEWGVNTSCDMGLRENEEWILFGNNINKTFVSVSSCNTWYHVKNANGERDWTYDGGLQAENQLRHLAGIPEKIIPDGWSTTFYPDKKTAVIEQYVNGKLQGNRKIFFSNGVLEQESNYMNGIQVGEQNSYSRNGQLLAKLIWEKGEIVHSVYWYDTSFVERRMSVIFLSLSVKNDEIPLAKMQIESEGWFDMNTRSWHSFVYYRSGVLQRENFSFCSDSIRHSCEYFESGILKSDINYFKIGDITEEKYWDEKGNMIAHKKWVNGKYLGNFLEKE